MITRRTIGWGLAVGALIAAIGAVFIATRPREPGRPVPPALVELAAAIGNQRPVLGRLSSPFGWEAASATVRSASRPPVSAAAVLERALASDRTVANLHAFGLAQLALGQPSVAVPLLEEAVEGAPADADLLSDLAAACFERAQRIDDAIELPKGLEAANKAIALDERHAAAWFNKALILERLKIRGQATAAWTRFIALEGATPWTSEARSHLDRLASPTITVDTQPLLESLFEDVLKRWAAAELAGNRAAAESALGEAKRLVTRIAEHTTDQTAHDSVRTIEKLSTPLRKTAARGHAAYADARRLYREDAYEPAAPLFSTAARDLAAAGSPVSALARIYAATIVYRSAPASAVPLLAAVRTGAGARAYPLVRGRAAWVEGMAIEATGSWRLAGVRFVDATRDLRTAGETANAAFVHGMIAGQSDRVGNAVRAWQIWTDSSAGAPREGQLLTAAISVSRLGWHHAARDLELGAIDVARAAQRRTTLADSLRRYAISSGRLGRGEDARRALDEARALAKDQAGAAWDRIRAEIDVAEALSTQVPPSVSLDAATRAAVYFKNTGSPSRLPELFLARGLARSALGNLDEAAADLREGIDVLAGIRSGLAPGVDQMTFSDVVRRLLSAYVEVQQRLGRSAEAFAAVEDARARDLPGVTPTPSLAQLQEAMPADATLLSFVVGDEQSVLWIVDRTASTTVRIAAGRAELARLVAAAGAPRWNRDAASRLRALLFAEAGRRLVKDRLLVVVPDGPLHLLPFAILPGSGSPYLIEDHPIVIAPSARAWLQASTRLQHFTAPPSDAFVAGNPRIDRQRHGDLPVLPFAEEEARAIAALYRVTPVVGEDVTRARVVNALDSAVVHFGGHALVNDTRPAESELLVWDPEGPGLLASEIRGLRLDTTRLIVLAACRSAAGQMTTTEGPIGLARAFLAAGSPSVVASHWVVADRSSMTFSLRLHQEYLKTGNTAAAVRAAQLAMIRSGDRALRTPESWAGFVAFGGTPFPSTPR